MINADEKQFNTIMTAYKFRYYREFNTDKELLRSEVTRRIREKNKVMWTFIIGFLVGGLVFGVLGFLAGNSKEEKKETESKKEEPNYIRRGIWSNGYSGGSGENKKKFEVQFELGEIESTSSKSKVVVISLVSSRSEYNDVHTKKRLSEMVDNTWMLSADIEWIDDTSKMRNDKIDQILGK